MTQTSISRTPISETDKMLLTCGGTETFLLFVQTFALREFCAFELLDDPDALAAMERGFFAPIAEAAVENGHALVLDTLVWRANSDFVARLGYAPGDLERFNRAGVDAMRRFAARFRTSRKLSAADFPVFVTGDVGPRGDGYQVSGEPLSVEQAEAFHRPQIAALAAAGVDAIVALTMTSVAESIAIARLAVERDLPVIVSPTVETDGRTPEGPGLGELIERVDHATGGAPLFYMVNCAHPSHLEPALRSAADRGETWLERFAGLRANASPKSHAELDNSDTLDRGAPAELAADIGRLAADFDLRLVGGCCGTDVEHIERIAAQVR